MNSSPSNPAELIDRRIDRLLEALDSVEAPAGLNSRVLAGLEDRTSVAALPGRRVWQLFAGRSWAHGLALAGGTAIAFLVVFGFLHEHRVPRATPPSPALAGSALVPSTPLQSPPPPAVAASSAQSVTSGRRVHPAGQRKPLDAGSEAARNLDQAALDDLHAPSYPAPPLPLTAQEKLIRRMMRRSDGVELAQLKSAIGAASAADNQAALHEFFDPPIHPLPEGETE